MYYDYYHNPTFTHWNKVYLYNFIGNYIEVKKLNFMLVIDILRNSSQYKIYFLLGLINDIPKAILNL